MAARVPCSGCKDGDHSRHVEIVVPVPKGVMGGAVCPCQGECEGRPKVDPLVLVWNGENEVTRGEVVQPMSGVEASTGEEHSTGAIAKAETIADFVATHVARWYKGAITTNDLAALVERANRQFARACWCDEGVCCKVHGKHTSPHKRCELR